MNVPFHHDTTVAIYFELQLKQLKYQPQLSAERNAPALHWLQAFILEATCTVYVCVNIIDVCVRVYWALEKPNTGYIHRQPDLGFAAVPAGNASDDAGAVGIKSIEAHAIDCLCRHINITPTLFTAGWLVGWCLTAFSAQIRQVRCSLQVTLCDPYLNALSVRYFNKGAI